MFTSKFDANNCPCWQNLLSAQLCKNCLQQLQGSLLPRSLSYEIDFSLEVFAMSHYSPKMKDFIYSCKSAAFNGLMPSQKNLIKELCAFWSQELKTKNIDAFVPIPAHPIRSILQSDLAWFIARYLSRELSKGEPLSVLKRKFFVSNHLYSAQKNLNRALRKEKIKEQYYVPVSKAAKMRICLVDDVCTTGSTLSLCKNLLEKAGHHVESAIVLSKVS